MSKHHTETCGECRRVMTNVGPWEDGRRLCGGCKVRIAFARPGFADSLAADIGGALGADSVLVTTDGRTRQVMCKKGNA